jgi:hypothetical protein
VQTEVALGNQLRAELERFWPGPVGLFTKLDSPVSLAFLERYPSPADARAGRAAPGSVSSAPALRCSPEASEAAHQASPRT